LLYNYHHSNLRDAVEAYIQLAQEKGMSYEEARRTLFLWYMGLSGILIGILGIANQVVGFIAGIGSAIFQKQLEQIFDTQPALLLANYQEHRQQFQEWLNRGYPIIFVAHSQGNFFVNAYSINSWLQPTDPNAPKPVIRVIHLATTTTRTAFQDSKSPYYTAEEDLVIATFVRNLAKIGINANVLPPNIKLGCSNCASELGDRFVRGFIEVYLNSKYPAGKSFLEIVSETIRRFTVEMIEEWYANFGVTPGDPFYEFNKLALNDRCPICGIDPPRFERLTCGSSISAYGGYQVTTIIVDVYDLPKDTTLSSYFEPYYIPDSICISHPPGMEKIKAIRIGRNVGTPNLPLIADFKVNTYRQKDPLTSKVVVIIVGEEGGKAWDFSLSASCK